MKKDLIFEEKYKNLNVEQKMAVDNIEGPVMVVAGPGTGKTTILTLRIANILRETDNPASAILALTFTEAGVSAMRAKLREIIGSRADEVHIHTFHGFSASVIAEFPEHFPYLSRATQITDIEAESLVREILGEKKFASLRPLGDPDYYVGKILGAISDAKKEDWTADIIADFAKKEIEKIKNDPESLSTRGLTKGQLKAEALKRIERSERTIIFADVYGKYEERKKEERKMDFDDLLFGLLEAIKTDKLLLQLLQEKFLYILVDEHQDTNDSQNEIVALLASFFDNPNLFVVGDEKQAIYRFQGASVENFLKFQNKWNEMKIISLQSNYRSHQSILDASFKMIEQNYADGEHTKLRVKLHSKAKSEQKPIELLVAGNNQAVDDILVERLQKIQKKESESTTAVIVRTNREVERVLSLCQKNGIEAKAERGADIFSHPIGILYFNLIGFLTDPTKVDLLAETLAVGLWNKNFSESIELIKKLRSGTIQNLEKEIPELNILRDESVRLGPIDYLLTVAEISGLAKMISASPLSTEVWREIVSLATELAKRSHIDNARDLLRELLAYKISAETKSIKISAGVQEASIQIMTAHSSKGLEYDYVFLPNATEQSWMHRVRSSPFVLPREKDEGDEVRDTRRLFYVCLTRARKHAVILTSQSDSLGKELSPLRFVDELDKEHIQIVKIPPSPSVPNILLGQDLNKLRKKEIVEYAKNILVEKGLSVTALNHFCACPSQFYYKSILKLPEPPRPSSEKGIAMHKALSLVWTNRLIADSPKMRKKIGATEISEIIKKTVTDYFKTSLLPVFEKEIIVEELIAFSEAVGRELEAYFNLAGSVSTESWFDALFLSQYKKQKFEIKLHGQMDALVETDIDAKVFDYKTREVMSENAILGNTKDSDGNYFRQLVFYKMLLEKNPRFKNKKIEPSLIFVKPDSKGHCQTVSLPIEKTDIEQVEKEIQVLVESVWSGSFLSDVCDEKDCQWCKMKKNNL